MISVPRSETESEEVMFWQALGFGVGVGIVHCSMLFVILFLARLNTRSRENETLDLMRERNAIDASVAEGIHGIRDAIREKL
jgi:hypothetical protein